MAYRTLRVGLLGVLLLPLTPKEAIDMLQVWCYGSGICGSKSIGIFVEGWETGDLVRWQCETDECPDEVMGRRVP